MGLFSTPPSIEQHSPSLPPSPSLDSITTPGLQLLLAPIASPAGSSGAKFTNWATTYACQTSSLFRPTTVEQVRWVVELARREGKELRASGSGHSPSDLVCTKDYIINLDGMQQILQINPTTRVVHAEGGIKLSNFHVAVRKHGLAMSSLGSISDQSLAGSISTATHGAGVTYGNLSTFVRHLTLVLPDEKCTVVRVSETEDPELFKATLCGLGVTGIIVGVGIECEDDFKLEEECWSIKFEDFVERWQEIAESGEHVRCWWFPQVGEVKVSRMNRTQKAITPPPSFLTYWIQERLLAHHFHKIGLFVSRYFPNILPYHAQFMYALVHRPSPVNWTNLFRPIFPQFLNTMNQKALRSNSAGKITAINEKAEGKNTPVVITVESVATPPLSPGSEESLTFNKVKSPLPILTTPTYRVDLSNNIFNYDCGFPQYTYEGSVPYEKTGECLKDLESWMIKELHDPKGLRSHFPIEIRFTEKDDIWLSPTYGGRGTYIGAIQYRPFNLAVPYKALFTAFESNLLAHSGRPHWAKSHTCSRTQLEQMYPKFHDFLRVRARVDPKGVLLNAYSRRHLLGEVGETVDMRVFKALKR